MKILVTGASGYVGASIFTNLSKHYELIGIFQKNKLFNELIELDITNKEAVVQAFLTIRPELTIHAAAIPSRQVFLQFTLYEYEILRLTAPRGLMRFGFETAIAPRPACGFAT